MMSQIALICSISWIFLSFERLDGARFSFAAAFYIDGSRHHNTPIRSSTELFGSEGDNAESSSSEKGGMILNFVADFSVDSESVPFAGKSKMHEFFGTPKHALPLLRGSKNNQIKELKNVGADLIQRYEHVCGKVNASSPSSIDRFFEVETAGIQFPGLRVMTVATIAVKTLSTQALPGYEFVLVRNSIYAEGNRLFVWFFNKVTGKDGKEDHSGEQTTCSITRITVNENRPGDGMVSFNSKAFLSVQVSFPSILMKAIPGASKEKFERTGGSSLRKALVDDCPVALAHFREEYILWLELK
ncbi:hypothetical protein ACHAWF_005815 [Thalassiosira exigua]